MAIAASSTKFLRRPILLQVGQQPLGVRRGTRGQLCTRSLAPKAARGCSSSSSQLAQKSAWSRFVQWSYRTLGDFLYPEKTDIANCGVDMGITLPKPELLMRDGIKHGSWEWRMQMYGASLYWYLVTSPRDDVHSAEPDFLRGKDVLEVACMRGGGARYLSEVAGPRTYVATDNVEEHIDRCKKLHADTSASCLRFEVADAFTLHETYPAESFDLVLCVQAAANFTDIRVFVESAKYVLRQGGLLVMCDGVNRQASQLWQAALHDAGLEVEAWTDLSRAVHAVGLCELPQGRSYIRVTARRPLDDT